MQKMQKHTLFLSILFILICTILIVIPTGFSKSIYVNAVGAKVKILEVDNSTLINIGLFRQGEQSCQVEVLSKKHKGLIMSATNMLSGSLEQDKVFQVGETAWALIEQDKEDRPIFINLIDYYRLGKEVVFALLFSSLLVLFASTTGIKIILSLTFCFLSIVKLLIPGVLKGYNPLLLAIFVLALITVVTVLLVSGLNKRSYSAIIGAFCAFLLTFGFSIISVKLFKIHGSVLPQSEGLLYSGFQGLDLTLLFTAVICLSSGGAIIDLSIDISAAMWEVMEHCPTIEKKELIYSGLNVGKAGVGTQITTLILAYMGSYLTVMMVYMAQGTPLLNILTSKTIAAEIIQSIVGCSALIFVVPFTSIISSWFFKR